MLPPTVHVSPSALFQLIEGEAVILDLASSSYFGLDNVGARFWQLLQLDPDVAAACNQLLREYDVEAARLEHDIGRLIQQLAQAGLVTLG